MVTAAQPRVIEAHATLESDPATQALTTISPSRPTRSRRFNISVEQVTKATADYPDSLKTALRWLHWYCAENDLPKAEMGTLLRKENGDYYSGDSIYQAITGRRLPDQLGPFHKSIETFRAIVEERRGQVSSGFIETRLYRRFEKICRRALLRSRISFVFSSSHIGKTASAREYQRRFNHGETVYVETPARATYLHFMQELGKALRITRQSKVADLRERIVESFDDRKLLIVDEAHLAFRGRGDSGLNIFDFLKELYNRKRCGIVIIMTNEGRDELRTGRHSGALRQLWNRRITPLQLPAVPPSDDLDRFAAAYGLPPAPDEDVRVRLTVIDDHGEEKDRFHSDNPRRIQTHVVRHESLGVWLTILQDASDIAREARKPISWGAVIKAYCQSLAEEEEMK